MTSQFAGKGVKNLVTISLSDHSKKIRVKIRGEGWVKQFKTECHGGAKEEGGGPQI